MAITCPNWWLVGGFHAHLGILPINLAQDRAAAFLLRHQCENLNSLIFGSLNVTHEDKKLLTTIGSRHYCRFPS